MTHTFVASQGLILTSFVPPLHVFSFESMLPLLFGADGEYTLNYFSHLVKLSLHIRNKSELISRSVKVMVGTVYLEVCIALKIVGKKSHSALQRHHNSAYG